MTTLIKQLPDGPLDIIGDIHGEYNALVALLTHLGYDENGKHNNVFCIDFSVGKRWKERCEGITKNYSGKLAALRWPEKTLMFDDGLTLKTITGQPCLPTSNLNSPQIN